MEIRLNKFLSEAGICSRREADRLIESGKVTVDGKPAVTGMKINESQVVLVGKKEVRPKSEMVLLAVNKPVGIVCTEEKREKNKVRRV
jgi:23S rRNA pseudouridine2604 synthase